MRNELPTRARPRSQSSCRTWCRRWSRRVFRSACRSFAARGGKHLRVLAGGRHWLGNPSRPRGSIRSTSCTAGSGEKILEGRPGPAVRESATRRPRRHPEPAPAINKYLIEGVLRRRCASRVVREGDIESVEVFISPLHEPIGRSAVRSARKPAGAGAIQLQYSACVLPEAGLAFRKFRKVVLAPGIRDPARRVKVTVDESNEGEVCADRIDDPNEDPRRFTDALEQHAPHPRIPQ